MTEITNPPPYLSKLLTPFLASPQRPDGTMTFHQLQGFLFAIACAPELIKPSEWLPLVFNEQEAGYASEEEARSVLQALMDLYNVINAQVFTTEVALPDDIQFELPPLNNVGEAAALGQWSQGFFMGHDWLKELWDHYTPEVLDEELGSCLMVLSFFSSRQLAEAFHREATKTSGTSLEAFAEKLLGMVEDAMGSYAHLGRSIQTALAEQAHDHQPTVVRAPKVGRNDPCPCGSGKKYKKCCLQ
jgi:uncharacterized protein